MLVNLHRVRAVDATKRLGRESGYTYVSILDLGAVGCADGLKVLFGLACALGPLVVLLVVGDFNVEEAVHGC